jgi:drug/metabolite transporter (DMT)-like permease
MELWIILSLAAATAQTARFMLQKQLKTAGLSNGGATFARFCYTAPLIAAVSLSYGAASGQALPEIPLGFWPFAIMGALSQILATVCVVALFSYRNFAVGITFKKTEVVLTALVGFLILGERVSLIGGAAIGLGLFGVLLLSDPPGGTDRSWRRFVNPAAGLGLTSGLFFAFSGVGYGGAARALGEADLILRAGLSLAIVTAMQTVAMGLWLRLREPGEIGRVLAAWRISVPVGLTSLLGSFCWMAAFTLQQVSYVFAVGQVEVILSIAASALFFKETITRREYAGIALLAAGILVLVLYL